MASGKSTKRKSASEEAKEDKKISKIDSKPFTFFYTNKSPFSQFYSCEFTIDGVTFNCAEQYMMYSKAVLFKDEKIAEKILKCCVPMEQKKLGRQVSNYDDDVWNKHDVGVVRKGNMAKFSQNEELLQQLLATRGTELVEASPRDRKWGIGMSDKNPKCMNKATWRGRNLLGETLTQVREELLAKQ